MPVSGSVMLGEMNPGQTAQVVAWDASEGYAFVRDGRTGDKRDRKLPKVQAV